MGAGHHLTRFSRVSEYTESPSLDLREKTSRRYALKGWSQLFGIPFVEASDR